jgi:L-asparaginase
MRKSTSLFCVIFLLVGLAMPFAAQAGNGENLPTVHIFTTGGTIAGQAASSTQLTDYKAGVLTPGQLISAVPALADHAQISAEQIASIDSSNITKQIWLQLAKRINEVFASGEADGVVITHGTDTLEETAYFLHLVIKSDKPVVLVGAMRPASAISADGPMNLLQAVAAAASPESKDKGVFIIMNGEINCAREVTKTNTSSVETFRSNDLGLMGYMINTTPRFYRLSSRKHTMNSEFDVSKLEDLPNVEIVYNYAHPNLDMIKALVASRPDGIVVAGTGNGSIYSGYIETLREASKAGIPVICSSRVGAGPVSLDSEYAANNFISADNLNPQKARILLMLALTNTRDFKEITRIFAEY